MADRSQNITINYKFNTAEIEKANAILNRANTATNNLQASGQKAGQQVAAGFQKATPAIEQMRIQLARLKTQIEVSSDPKRVAELSNQYKVLKAQLDAATKSAFNHSKAMKETAQSTQSLAGQFGNLYQAAKLFVTAGILREVVDITLSMATLKGNVEGVEAAFKRAIPNEVAVLSELRRATKGTVSDFELMKQALQAQNFGLPVEKLGRLLEFATAKAQQTGLSIDYITNSLVTGLGRKSERVFDNLQLDIAELRKRIATGLDFRDAGIQLIEEDLAKMGGVMVTTATQADQLKESWEALRIELAKKVESGGVISFVEGAIDGLKALLQGNKEVGEEFLRTVGANQAARVKESEAFKQAGSDRQKQFDIIQQEINTRVELIRKTNESVAAKREEAKGLMNFRVGNQAAIDGIKEQIGVLQQRNFVQAAAILALKEYLAELNKLANVEPEFETISKLQEKLKELKRQREEDTFTGNTGELDRLQREIILLEDRILKISDNIAWQKQWDQSRITSSLATEQETENLKKFNDELDKLTEKMAGDISFSTGDLLNPNRDAKETIDIDALEQDVKEVAELIEMSLGKEFLIRFRLGLQGKGGETSDLQAGINAAMKEFQLGLVDIAADQLNATREIELQSMKLRLNDLKKFFDEQIELAGNNEQAKRALRKREEKETAELNRKIFEKEKQTRRSQAIIDGAAGVVKAFATYPWPVALIISGLLTAKTLSQLSIINKQKPGFAKGVIDLKGHGTGTSDSIPANLSRGESVMTAWETRHAGDVLKDIRAKKLDNKVLKNLKQGRDPIVSQQQFNDEKIIKAIEKNRPPDVVSQSGIVYEVRKKGETYQNKVRAKSVRL